jgi:hypothetical protein
MMRPCDQDAILGHVASRGDRIPRAANKTRNGATCQQAAFDVFVLAITTGSAAPLAGQHRMERRIAK